MNFVLGATVACTYTYNVVKCIPVNQLTRMVVDGMPPHQMRGFGPGGGVGRSKGKGVDGEVGVAHLGDGVGSITRAQATLTGDALNSPNLFVFFEI